MSKLKTFVKFATTLAAGASGGFIAATKSMEDYLIQPPTFANLEPRPIPKPYDFEWGPVVTWDYNWDLRHYFEEDQKTPTATRHLLLIRHGQYNLEGKSDTERYLTQLGIQQATLTGQRLAELNLPNSSMVCSTMTRAIQTAGLIQQSLPENVEILPHDSILEEGAPYPPEPKVRITTSIFFINSSFIFLH